MNIFEAVKKSITTRQAAEHYEIKVSRKGMACCPFHKDRTPSMKVDERYYCFGCGATGDVIDFVASFHNLGKKDAAVKLVQDFGVDYDEEWHKKVTVPAKRTVPKLSFEQRYEQAKTRCIRVLLDYRRLLRSGKELYAPKMEDKNWHPLFCEALQESSHIVV
ncbi:MAG: CHC2 zinc finger domain-containing protein [Lachnospiraceae bacterium]|nr:CHC2 zinc finger domain-containing protein [Lachnospiraceae bacterium]